jgi:predicted transcriptional regulator
LHATRTFCIPRANVECPWGCDERGAHRLLFFGIMSPAWNRPVRDFTSRSLIAVHPTAPLEDVQRLFDERDISAVIVTDKGSLLGILSLTDLLREARVDLAAPGTLTRVTPPPRLAADLMRRDVVAVDEETALADATAVMVRRHIHRVVVLRGGRPVGVVTTRDAMRAVLEERITKPLREVMSAPVSTIEMGVSAEQALESLDDSNVRGLVVVDGDWPIGAFTQREALHVRGLPPNLRAMPVERVMSYETICLDVATPLYRVAGYAMQMRARRVLAVEKRELVGIVTGLDLMRVMV